MKILPQVCELVEHLKFDNIKQNSAVNPSVTMVNEKGGNFMRKGVVGDWKNHFDEGSADHWDKWIQKNVEGTGIQFYSGGDGV